MSRFWNMNEPELQKTSWFRKGSQKWGEFTKIKLLERAIVEKDGMRWKSCPAYTSLSQETLHRAVVPFPSLLDLPAHRLPLLAEPSILLFTWKLLGSKRGQNNFSSLFASCAFLLQKRTQVTSLLKPPKPPRGADTPFCPTGCSAPVVCFHPQG